MTLWDSVCDSMCESVWEVCEIVWDQKIKKIFKVNDCFEKNRKISWKAGGGMDGEVRGRWKRESSICIYIYIFTYFDVDDQLDD